RAEVAVIGYESSYVGSAFGGALQGKSFVTLPELQMYPLSIEQRKRKEIDETGQVFEIDVQFPIWVRPLSDGGTSMCEALHQAQQVAWEWADTHPDSYPPVIVNVSDGVATDGDPAREARLITEVATNDGQALLFNVHITDLNSTPV